MGMADRSQIRRPTSQTNPFRKTTLMRQSIQPPAEGLCRMPKTKFGMSRRTSSYLERLDANT